MAVAGEMTDPMRGTLGAQVAATLSPAASMGTATATAEEVLGVVAQWLLQRARWCDKQPVKLRHALGRVLVVQGLRQVARTIEREREEMHRGTGR